MTDIRKPWSAYPDDYRAALMRAYLDGYDANFPAAHLADSWQARMQWMSADIRRQADAPQELREAATQVKWNEPRATVSGWTVHGAVRARMPVTDEQLIAHLRDASDSTE